MNYFALELLKLSLPGKSDRASSRVDHQGRHDQQLAHHQPAPTGAADLVGATAARDNRLGPVDRTRLNNSRYRVMLRRASLDLVRHRAYLPAMMFMTTFFPLN